MQGNGTKVIFLENGIDRSFSECYDTDKACNNVVIFGARRFRGLETMANGFFVKEFSFE